MTNEWIGPGMLFLAVTGLLWTLVAIVRGRRKVAADEPPPDAPVFGPLTPALAEQMPMSSEALQQLAQELRQGGYYQPSASNSYRAMRALLVLIPLIAGGGLALAVPDSQTPRVLVYTAVAAILGYSLPRIYLTLRVRHRTRQVERGLPLAIDLLTLCLTAGQNLFAALKQVSRELAYSHPVLSKELGLAYRHAELHSLESAMKLWTSRCPSPEVTNLALILIQSEQLGTDVAFTLQEMASHLRTTARQRAEAQANRSSFWLLLPTIFCFWIASAIILIGPPYLDFFQKQRQSTTQFGEMMRKNLERANKQPPPRRIRPASEVQVKTQAQYNAEKAAAAAAAKENP